MTPPAVPGKPPTGQGARGREGGSATAQYGLLLALVAVVAGASASVAGAAVRDWLSPARATAQLPGGSPGPGWSETLP
jgi:Flp pilus assembly pilin Flp